MDYQKHYNKLIERARNRLLEGYVEEHHIIPKCMDGLNDAANIVALTPEEHYVAHQLLIKMYPNESKLIFAVKMMTVRSPKHSRNNKLYGWLKRKYSNTPFSEKHKKRLSVSGKGRKFSERHKKRIGTANKGNISQNKGKTWEEIYGLEKAIRLKEARKGKPSGMSGKHHKEESKQK